MARSRRKNPVFGIACGTDTDARRDARRAERRHGNAVARAAVLDPDVAEVADTALPRLREVSNVWQWPCDGKFRWADAPASVMRK